VGSVAVQHWGITSHDTVGVVKDDDLGLEVTGLLRRIVLDITCRHNIAYMAQRHDRIC